MHKLRYNDSLTKIIDWLRCNKELAAWVCYCVILFAQFFAGGSGIKYTAIAIYLGVITAVLFDISRQVDPSRRRYGSQQEANPDILNEIDKALAHNQPCEICWIGVTMQSAWLALENKLLPKIHANNISNLSIKLVQSSPNYLREILKDNEAAEITERQNAYIKSVCKRVAENLERTGSEISIVTYDYMPNYHGILINDSVLFLSNVRWGGKDFSELNVPHEPFTRYDMKTEEGAYMIGLYKSWLEKNYSAPNNSFYSSKNEIYSS